MLCEEIVVNIKSFFAMPAVGVLLNFLSFFIGEFGKDEKRIQKSAKVYQAKGSTFYWESLLVEELLLTMWESIHDQTNLMANQQ